MKRRDFVLLTTGGLTAVALPSAYFYFGNSEFDPALAQPKALSMIWDDAAIIEIGKKYRSQVPEESEQRTLVRHLGDTAGQTETMVIDDFVAGRHVVVDGWILSATEARQCGLASLGTSKP